MERGGAAGFQKLVRQTQVSCSVCRVINGIRTEYKNGATEPNHILGQVTVDVRPPETPGETSEKTAHLA